MPDNVAVVGFNDVPFAEFFHPALTTAVYPSHELGRVCAERILEWIETGKKPALRAQGALVQSQYFRE